MLTITTARSRVLLGLALVAGLAAPALAESRIDVIASSAKTRTQQSQVQIGDLNLTSTKGMAMLDRRIAFAASNVCGKDQLYSLDAKSDYLRCRTDAIADAHNQIQQRFANFNGTTRVTG